MRVAEGDSSAARGWDGSGSDAEALKRYALIVESMTEGVSLSTEDGIIVYTNAAEDAMFGYAPGELVGRHVSEQNAYPPEENAERVAQVIETLTSEGRWEGVWHNRRKDGSRFHTASRITAVDLDGRPHFLCVQRDVTAQREAEAAHRKSEERLQLAIEGTGVGIYDLDLAKGEGFWSDSAFRMLGYEPPADGRASWQMWRDRLHPDDAEFVLAEHVRAESTGDLRVEFRIRRADTGETRWLSAYGRMLPGPEGPRSIGTVLDTTARKEAEAAIRESEARLRVALEAGRLGSWWFDVAGMEGRFSATAAAMLGLDPEVRTASYEEWRAMLHPDDLPAAEEAFTVVLADSSRAYEIEYRIIRPDGEVRRLEVLGTVEREAPGRAVRVVGTFRDVTELRAAEEALRDNARRLDLAVTAHGIGIFDWDVQTGAVVWTGQEEELFGLPPGAFGGHISNWAESLPPEEAERMNALMRQAMAERRDVLDFDFRIRRGDTGELRWIEGSGRILYAEDGTPLKMVGTNIDVTERRHAEERQRLLVNELNHRVKNTLAIIQGIAHQSFKGGDLSGAAREAFEGRLAALSAAHNILTRENWEAASIGQIVADALGPYQSARVSADGPDMRLPSKTAVSLALALHELATNAAKYGALSAPDGRVRVAWTSDGGRLDLIWEERDGPAVSPPAHRGFGTRMIERALAAELGGEARIEFEPAGVVCRLTAAVPAVPAQAA
ncbi:MAG TPA: PAS domain-containing protein [Allosphingosinicella sp.]